jgi:hypothetical protein
MAGRAEEDGAEFALRRVNPQHRHAAIDQAAFFKNEAMSRGIALTGNGLPFANMAIAVADYDGDGLLDFFITHLGNETYTLWRQGPVGQFRDRTQDSRVIRTAWRGPHSGPWPPTSTGTGGRILPT